MYAPTPLAPLSSGVPPHPRSTPSHARGGKIKRGKMIIAHFNPKELEELDEWQGRKEEDDRTGMRSYAHLEELLKNPHILRSLFQHAHEMSQQKPRRRAAGGPLHDYHDAKLNHMADQGIKGDTELAMIGPHTRNVFNALLEVSGHPPDHNPTSKKPQYANLGGIIGALGNVLSPMGGMPGMPTLHPAVRQIAQQGLNPAGHHLVPSPLGQLAGQYASKLFAGGSPIQQIIPEQQQEKQQANLSKLGQLGTQSNFATNETPQGNPQGTPNALNQPQPYQDQSRGMPGRYWTQGTVNQPQPQMGQGVGQMGQSMGQTITPQWGEDAQQYSPQPFSQMTNAQ